MLSALPNFLDNIPIRGTLLEFLHPPSVKFSVLQRNEAPYGQTSDEKGECCGENLMPFVSEESVKPSEKRERGKPSL